MAEKSEIGVNSSMKKLLYKIWSKFLIKFGDVKIFKWPMWIIYDPDDYQISGKNIFELMSILEPGDIILRGYRHYLDGKFIPNFPNNEIGEGFSHGAIYIGNMKIIHAVTEGISEINLIDFCQCDGLCLLRPVNESLSNQAVSIAKLNLGKPYDFKFNSNDSSEFYCHELVRTCYPEINIEGFYPSILGISLKCCQKRYIDRSFINNKEFKNILEI